MRSSPARFPRPLLFLLAAMIPWLCTARAHAQTDDQAFNAFIRQQVEYHKAHPGEPLRIVHEHHGEEGTGSGGESQASGDAAKQQAALVSPPVNLPGGGGAGTGKGSQDATAEAITRTAAFRWIAGIVGGLVLALGVAIGRQGNFRGAVIVGGSGLAVLLGAAFFPEWLELGLLALFLVNVAEYAYTHGLLTGTLASVATALHTAGSGVSQGFNTAMSGIAETPEAALLNRVAKANDATSVRV